VVATAKRDQKAGEVLDGEGGYTVYGKLMPAARAHALGGVPLGLAHGWKLVKAVPAGQQVKWSDIAFDAGSTAVRLRREMESLFAERARSAA
jgi:predicted homoserine dehydrogenase-like protein